MDRFSGGELGMSSGKRRMSLVMEKIEPFKELNEFHVSDLVWGKVKNYPWWPGEIVEPCTASASGTKKKKESFLIAYFGDDSVLWSETSKIKPFERHFSELSKESNDEAFCHAVNEALEEYSRRIEAGLACPCLPEDALGKVVSTNSGGGSFAEAFQPEEIVSYLQTLTKSPQPDSDALKFATVKAHLSSFYRRKGYNDLPCMEHFDLEEDSDTGLHASLKEIDLNLKIDRKRKSLATENPGSSCEGRPRKTVASESRVSSLSGLKDQGNPTTDERLSKLWDAAEELKLRKKRLEKRESEVIRKEACLEETKKELASLKESLEKQQTEYRSRESLLLKKESELIDSKNKLEKVEVFLDEKMKAVVLKEQTIQAQLEEKEKKFRKWEDDLDAKEIIQNSMEFELREAGKTVEDRRKMLVAYTEKVGKICSEYRESRNGSGK